MTSDDVVTLKLEEMTELPKKLIDAAQEGKLVLILGAGASINIDKAKPKWEDLATSMVEKYRSLNTNEKLIKKCDLILKDPYATDYKEIFSRLEEADPTEFWDNLRDIIYTIPKKENLGLAHILAHLNPLLIITTNWDRLLDSMQDYEIINWKDNYHDSKGDNHNSKGDNHNSKGDNHDNKNEDHLYLKFTKRLKLKQPSVLFLHGHISRLDTVLITFDQYEKLYDIENKWKEAGRIKGFRKEFGYASDLQEILSQTDIEILFFGMNPKNPEFSGICTSLFGSSQRRIFILSSINAQEIPQTIKQKIILLQYPDGRRDLAQDLLVKLPPRNIDSQDPRKYQVFSTFQRKEYLLAQMELEKKALSIKYCTENFTNVFGDDPYLQKMSAEHVDKVRGKKITGSPFKNINEFEESVLEGMKARRRNLYELINDKKIKRIDVLFKKDPKDLPQSEIERIKNAITMCRQNDVDIHIKWFNLEDHNYLIEKEGPFKDPSMALIIGNSKADFTVGLCHASQANDKSPISFQWVHKDTIFSNNRLGWFTRTWDLAQDYNVDPLI